MKIGHLIEYNKENTLFKNFTENEAGRLVPMLFLFFKKGLWRVKAMVCILVSRYFDRPQLDMQWKQTV